MVRVLAFCSVDPSLNPAEAYSFSSVNCLKRMKLNRWSILINKNR